MFYFGYQRFNGVVHGVKFDEDHAPSHRTVLQKHEISKDEFKFATWGYLKKKHPLGEKTDEASFIQIGSTETEELRVDLS